MERRLIMNNKVHFFKKDDDYVLYDCDRMQFFLIPSKVGSYIEKLKDDEKYIFIDEALKAATAIYSCNIISKLPT
jgi:hypothetical protein